MTIQIKKGNTEESRDINEIEIADLWHVAMFLKDEGKPTASEQVLQCWHDAHDMKNHIIEFDVFKGLLQEVLEQQSDQGFINLDLGARIESSLKGQ